MRYSLSKTVHCLSLSSVISSYLLRKGKSFPERKASGRRKIFRKHDSGLQGNAGFENSDFVVAVLFIQRLLPAGHIEDERREAF